MCVTPTSLKKQTDQLSAMDKRFYLSGIAVVQNAVVALRDGDASVPAAYALFVVVARTFILHSDETVLRRQAGDGVGASGHLSFWHQLQHHVNGLALWLHGI